MGWKKHFSPVSVNSSVLSPISGGGKAGPARMNYSSYLPDVYTGAPNRVERYLQYDTMDMDSEVNAGLDILAEFCTQQNKQNNTPFQIKYRDQATNSETKILKEYLQQWCKLQQLDVRMFTMSRNLFKYGDLFFIRDPETLKWMYIDPGKITKIIVNESEGKKPEQYVIRDLNPNFINLVTTQINPSTQNTRPGGVAFVGGGAGARGMTGAYPQVTGDRFSMNQNEYAINAEHVVHISLSTGLDNMYPFGQSRLETLYKVYKQKELLEDAIIIYRVQRAPERRIFYIDVGNLPSHLAMAYVDRVKNEIHQRRIPSASGQGGGASMIDSSYNPLATMDDYYLPVTSEGRSSRIETLPGGCFSMDTKVRLLDNRHLSIREIEQELSTGKELWTYSCEPKTGKIVPGIISWAGVTQKSAQVLKLTLDNGQEIICTPDHKFASYEAEYIRAEDLTVNQVLIPLYTNGDNYFDNKDKVWMNVEVNHNITDVPNDIKVKSIEYLPDFIEVGTLTIDQDETYHGFHTFALSAGVFVFNSSLGEITDLSFFTNKLVRALRIPAAYLPTGAAESDVAYNDGRVGTAQIQELRFNKECERLQTLMIPQYDKEFKYFLAKNGINIDFSLFDLVFQPPQNFASYRQAELDNQRISTFTQMVALPFMSKRYALKRFLGLTDDEIAENERLWKEESGLGQVIKTDSASEMRSAGVTPAGIQSDQAMMSEPEVSPFEQQPEGPAPTGAETVAPTPPPTGM